MTLFIFIILTVALGNNRHPDESPQTYTVRKISGSIQLSGKGDDPHWREAIALTDFRYPWDQGTPQSTTFRALHDERWVYYLFHVKDDNVTIAAPESAEKRKAASSSRAEIFFKIDDSMSPYYCLEMDPKGRVLDYEGTYHRKFNFNWSWPAGALIVKTSQDRDGYSIELAISKASLTDLGLLKDNVLQAGVFRADCQLKNNGDRDFKWISWITPNSKTPDFHIPSAFGILHLKP